MKKITLLSLLMLSSLGFAQTKSTGLKTFVTGLTANLTLDNSTSTITLTLNGPSDRWIAFKLGSFTTAMSNGIDGVYYNGTTLVDGNGGELDTDTTQNWSVSSNTVNAGVRTIVATRMSSMRQLEAPSRNVSPTRLSKTISSSSSPTRAEPLSPPARNTG